MPSESATAKAVDPRAAWSVEAYLLAAAVDTLAAANWQRAGKKSAPKPKPIKRPGDDRKKIGTARSADAFDAVYAKALERVRQVEEAGGVAWQ